MRLALILTALAFMSAPLAQGGELDDWKRLGTSASGRPIRIADTPTRELLSEVADLFEVDGSDLRWIRTRRQGSLHMAEYRQYFDDRPVFDSSVRLVIGEGRLVAAFGRGARQASRTWPDAVDVHARPDGLLSRLDDGAEFVGHRHGWITNETAVAIPVVEIDANQIEPEYKATLTFELPGGQCIRRRSRIVFCDLCGSAEGLATVGFDHLGTGSDSLPLPLANLILEVDASTDSILTGEDGSFCWDVPGCSSVSLTGTLSGLYVDVLDDDGPELSFATGPVTPGDPVEIRLNDAMLDADTAEVNAYVHVNLAHDWFSGLMLDPPFTDLDFPLQVRVNRQSFGTCNAAFDPSVPELFFLPAGGGCPNSAYSSVIYHEYVHAIVYEIMGGFPDFDLNEGLADAGSMLLTGHRLIGRDFYGLGVHLRDLEPDLVFPVAGDIWTRGRVVGGAFFDLRTRLFHELGHEEGQALAELLYAKSLYFMPDSIGDGVVTAVLLADDDNADLSDGTPHSDWILESFQIHGLQDQTVIVPPIRSLSDQISQGLVTFTWLTTTPYDEIVVDRDGELLANLPGDATFFLDDAPTPGLHTYLFIARAAGVDSPATPVLVPIDDYTRGDPSTDNAVDLTDVFALLEAIYSGAPLRCPDAGDFDDDGQIAIADAILLLEYLFQDGIAPTAPFPLPGLDPSVDFLPCAGEL